jgi:hypothetical protein
VELYFNTSLHVFDPSCGSLQSVGGHNVISKESVEDPDNPRRRNVLREKLSVALSKIRGSARREGEIKKDGKSHWISTAISSNENYTSDQ